MTPVPVIIPGPVNTGMVTTCPTEKNEEVVELYVSANTTYNGPNFFRAPQHLTKLENGKYAYVVK